MREGVRAVCVCVCVCVGERERMCVYVCVFDVCVGWGGVGGMNIPLETHAHSSVCVWKRERMCVCV